jgi:hypothetical protein
MSHKAQIKDFHKQKINFSFLLYENAPIDSKACLFTKLSDLCSKTLLKKKCNGCWKFFVGCKIPVNLLKNNPFSDIFLDRYK